MKHTPLFLNYSRVMSALMGLCAGSAMACQQGGGATSIFELPTLGGPGVQVNGLNALGQITGFSDTSDGFSHAFLYGSNFQIDIGTLGGSFSEGLALNNTGMVVGDSDVNALSFHAFSYLGTNLVDLGTLGGADSMATALNDAGQIVGSSINGNGTQEAFLYQSNSITGLGDLGGLGSSAIAINQSGYIAGNSADVFGNNHAVAWTNGLIVDLGTLGIDSQAVALNNSNVIVGISTTGAGESHGFVYANGGMTDLGTLGGDFSAARGINDNGLIIGQSSTSDGYFHAFMDNGSLVDLGTLGGNDSDANAINNLGHIVGSATLSNGAGHAFIWRNGTMTDLNDLLPANSGWELFSAEFINDSDRVVGFGNHNGFKVFVMDIGGVANNPPVADAGTNQTVDCQTMAVLDGSHSSDPDGDVLTFQWSEGNLVLGTNAVLQVSLPVGVHQVSLQVSDPCGASTTANVQITVTDSTAPVVTCPPPMTAAVDSNCQASIPNVTGLVTASDNCAAQNSLTVTQNPSAGVLVGPGQHDITVSATDPSGNTGSCTVSFTVVDTMPPVIISGPAIPTLSAGEGCQAAVPSVTGNIVASDNCTPANQLVISQNPAAGTLVGLGEHMIIITVTDASSNSTQGSLTFEVADTTAPVISSVSGPITLAAGANCSATVPDITGSVVASDNCTAANQLAISQSPAAGTSFNAGQHTITVTVTDAAGNHSSASVLVTVVDNTAPVISSVSGPITLAAGANCSATVPDVTGSVVASDNCTAANQLAVSQSPAAGTSFNAGQHTITVTVTDATGNHSSANVLVTVADNTAPVIQSITASPNVLAPANGRSVPVTVFVSATDNCDSAPVSQIVSVTSNETVASGDISITGPLTVNLVADRNPSGTGRIYTITVRTTDASGNSTTGTVQVTVPKGNGKKG